MPGDVRYRIDVRPLAFVNILVGKPQMSPIKHIDLHLHWAAAPNLPSQHLYDYFEEVSTGLCKTLAMGFPALQNLNIVWEPPSAHAVYYLGTRCDDVNCLRCIPAVGPPMSAVFSLLKPLRCLRHGSENKPFISMQEGSAVTGDELAQEQDHSRLEGFEMPKCDNSTLRGRSEDEKKHVPEDHIIICQRTLYR